MSLFFYVNSLLSPYCTICLRKNSMDWAKKGEELYNQYVRPYGSVTREISLINSFNVSVRGSKPITLTEYQEEALFHLHNGKNVVVYKTRQCGYTTLMLLHMIYILDIEFCTNNYHCVSDILYVAPNGAMREEAKNKLKEIVQSCTLGNSEGFLKEALKHITFMTYDRVDMLCSRRFDYAFYDEFAFADVQDFENFVHCAYATMLSDREPKHHLPPVGTSLFASSFSNENEERAKKAVEKMLSNNAVIMETHWYEVPTLNKNLVWKKYEVEPTIDKEGNVRYDKERWTKKIAEGWIPTSPKFEKLCETLGEEKAKIELLN